MGRRANGRLRGIAGVLMLVLAATAAAECMTAGMTPEHRACCAALKGDCGTSIKSHCCPPEAQVSKSLVASKPTLDANPVAMLVAVLSVPPVVPLATTHVVGAPDPSSSGPPGVPTYLFVSSLRI